MTQVAVIPPATGGCDFASAPSAMAADKAPLVVNLLGDAGILRPRGPWRFTATLPASGHTRLLGVWAAGSKINVTRDSGTGTHPYTAATWFTRHLRQGASTSSATSYDLDTTGATTTARTNAVQLGWGGRTYWKDVAWGFAGNGLFSFSTDSAGVGPGGFGGKLTYWGANTSPGNGAFTGDAPWGGADLAVYSDRLWCAGGAKNTGNNIELNTLWYSRAGDPYNWADDGVNMNNIRIADGSNDGLTGLAAINSALLIFQSRAVYRLSGAGNSTFRVTKVASNVGCIDAHSIVPMDNGAYFMGRGGLYYSDGYTVTYLSGPVEAHLRPALSAMSARTQVVALDEEWLLVNQVTLTGTAAAPEFAALYNRRTGAWVMHDTAVTSFQAVAGLSPRQARIWTPARAPHRVLVASDGTPYAVNDTTIFRGDELVVAADDRAHDDTATANTYLPIPCKWWSRPIRLSAPLQAAQLQKVMLDYQFVRTSTTTTGWRLSVSDGYGNDLLADTPLAAESAADATADSLYRRRFQVEKFSEATDAQVRVEFDGASTTAAGDLGQQVGVMEAAVEFEAARKRPTA